MTRFSSAVHRILPIAMLLAAAQPALSQPLPGKLPLATPGPDSFQVRFETTKGSFTMTARRAWSPLGVDRLYHLAKASFYDGAVIYRVGGTRSYPGGMVVQFGLTDDSLVNRSTGLGSRPGSPTSRSGSATAAAP
jgi:hypothetical protein